MANLAIHGSEFVAVEVRSGADWIKIPGLQSYAESGGEAPERDIITFDGAYKRTGHPRVPNIEIGAVYQPAHRAWKALRAASFARTPLNFRVTTKELEQFAINLDNHTVAITDAGVVTFAGDEKPAANKLGPGMVIEVGGKKYVIDTVSDDETPAVTVNPVPSAAVTAVKDYKILLPSVRRDSFPAGVRVADNVSLESESDMSTTLTLTPETRLPEWKVV